MQVWNINFFLKTKVSRYIYMDYLGLNENIYLIIFQKFFINMLFSLDFLSNYYIFQIIYQIFYINN